MKKPTAQAQIQAANAAGKIPVVVHNGQPCFATWDEKAQAVVYEPCPRRMPRARRVDK